LFESKEGSRTDLEVYLLAVQKYQQRDFKLSGLNGISDQQLQVHFALYAGYVNNTNTLNEKITELAKAGKAGTPECAEMVRRQGFEYNGLILHEYYFGNLKSPGGASSLEAGSPLGKAIEQSFGSVQDWMASFKAVGAMRGVGWAILFQDPVNGDLSNHWVTLHQDGNPAGFKPILVMDVWEHAFMVDYKPAERGKYIEAFFSNVDWSVVEQRLTQSATIR
jgi:Fe-Mn family superoxide dismutase